MWQLNLKKGNENQTHQLMNSRGENPQIDEMHWGKWPENTCKNRLQTNQESPCDDVSEVIPHVKDTTGSCWKNKQTKKKKKINISKNIKKWKKYKTWVDNLTKIIPVNMPGFPNTYWGRRKRLAQKQIFNQICSYVFYEGVEKSVI